MMNEVSVQYTMSPLTEKESKCLNILRVFSILSAMAAHVFEYNSIAISSIHDFFLYIWHPTLSYFGVPCFFLLGGFFYKRTEGDAKTFWRKKTETLILPWFFCTLITYFVKLLLQQLFTSVNSLGIIDYLRWIFGFGTLYYFFTDFIVFLVGFKWIAKKEGWLYFCIVISAIVNMLRRIDPTLFEGSVRYFFTAIPINMGFFALGILGRRHRWDRVLLNHKEGCYFAFVVAVVCFFRMESGPTLLLPFWIIAMIVLSFYGANILVQTKVSEKLVELGSSTYCIYLLHLQIVQPICRNLPSVALIDILKPFISLAIMMILITVGKTVCKRIPYGDILCKLVGLR